jgi:hypothetical protein
MSKIIIDTTNVHRDEVEALTNQLDAECWKFDTLTKDEIKGVSQLIDYVISHRVNNRASELSYLELLNLRNKLNS